MKNKNTVLYESIMRNLTKKLPKVINEAVQKMETNEQLNEFRMKLDDTLVQFIFTKVNGDVRMAFGTTNEDWLDYFDADERPAMRGYGIQFYDVEAGGWRQLSLRRGTTTNVAFCQTFLTPKKLQTAIANEDERAEFMSDYMEAYSMQIDTNETPEEAAITVETAPIVQAAPVPENNDDELIDEMMSSSYVSTWRDCISQLSSESLRMRYTAMMNQMIRNGELER